MLNRTDISFISIILGFCWFKTLPAHSDHCRAVGSRVWDDIGPGSSGRYPGEPIPVWTGSVPKAHGLVRTTPASSDHLIPGGRHKVRQLPGGRRKPGLDYITWGIGVGDGVWRGQKDGSVVIQNPHPTLDLHTLIQLMNFLQGFCLCEPGVVKCLSRRRGASGCRLVLPPQSWPRREMETVTDEFSQTAGRGAGR